MLKIGSSTFLNALLRSKKRFVHSDTDDLVFFVNGDSCISQDSCRSCLARGAGRSIDHNDFFLPAIQLPLDGGNFSFHLLQVQCFPSFLFNGERRDNQHGLSSDLCGVAVPGLHQLVAELVRATHLGVYLEATPAEQFTDKLLSGDFF